MDNKHKNQNSRWIAAVIGVYILLAVLFHVIAGEELLKRVSRGNYNMEIADTGTIELVQGASVEQVFQTKIQRLQSISVQWGTAMRPNKGVATVSLFNNVTGELVAAESYDVSQITESQVTTLTLPEAREDLYNVPLRILLTSDSISGSALYPLKASYTEKDGFELRYNGVPSNGILCFTVAGTDYVWTGLHYWELTCILGIIILGYLLYVEHCRRIRRQCILLTIVGQLKCYGFLIKQLVARDFKSKYKRSVLGVLWSFLNPLLTMVVQYIVFSNLFRFEVPHYQVYLLCGIVLFNFFAEACSMMVTSVIGNASLILKVYIPKYVFPLTRTMSSMINLLIAMIPLWIVAMFSGIMPTKAYLLLPYVLLCLMVFTLGVGLILAASMVFFRDTQFLWGVISMIWMYLTPLFYPESILPSGVLSIVKCNPLYYYVDFVRTIIIGGVSPEPRIYAVCFIFALVTLVIGLFIFRKKQDEFVLYL